MADIRLAIAVDSAGAIRSIKTFNDEVDKTPASASRADGAVSALRKQFESFASGISIGAGIALTNRALDSFVSVAKGATTALLEYSDKMVTMKQRTDLGLGSLQVLNAVARTSGTDFETMAKGASLMEKAIGNGDGAFKKLGLSVSALKGMSADEAFTKVSGAVMSVGNAFERSAAGAAIFGKAFMEMLPALGEDLAAARQQAIDFGLVLSDNTLNAAEALGDKIDLAGMSLQAFGMRLAGMVAESPAVAAFFEGISRFFGSLAPLIENNKAVLLSLVKDGVNVATDAFVLLVKAITGAMSMLQAFRVGAAAMKEGLTVFTGKGGSEATAETNRLIAQWKEMDKLTDGVAANAEKFRKSVMGAGGSGSVASPKAAGVGGGGFSKVEVKVAELKIPSLPAGMWMDLFGGGSQGKFGTLQGGSKNYNLWGDSSKFLPPELAGNTHVGGADTIQKASFNASQALQDFANIAALSSSKLGKTLAQVFGSGAGLKGGIDAFSKAKGFLGNLGAVGSIASAGMGIISGIVGFFKKRPKEPAPEPPKQATAASWASFLGDQQSKGAVGVLAGVSGIKVTTPEDMAAQASIASQSFWAMFKTQGLIKAADAFRAVRDKMLETFKAAGASDSATAAMLGPMSTMVDLAGNESFRGAADGAQGFGEALASIANQQLPMSIDQFRAFEQQAVAGFEQMKQAAIAQGMSMEDAIKAAAQGSGAFLTTLKDASAKYGIDLGGSQAVFDAATGAGVAFAGDSQERLILSLNALTEALGGVPPKFEQAISNAGKSAGSDKEGMDSFADSMGRGFVDLGNMIIDGIKNLPQPQIYMDSGALVGGIAAAVDNGIGSALATALEGRNG